MIITNSKVDITVVCYQILDSEPEIRKKNVSLIGVCVQSDPWFKDNFFSKGHFCFQVKSHLIRRPINSKKSGVPK